MRPAWRLLAVLTVLAGTGALHAVASALELSACADACVGCGEEGEGTPAPCDDGCGAFCACCPAPAFAASQAPGVARCAGATTAVPVASADPPTVLASRGVFHPPRR